MKRNLFLCAAIGLLIAGQGIITEKYSAGFNQQVTARVAQASLIGSLSSVVSNEGVNGSKALQKDEPRYIIMEVVPDLMKFATDTFTVTTGEKIVLELDNLDGMQHNLLIAKPGTLEKVGAAADAMLSDPKAAAKHYVPEMPEVLFATPLVDPGEIYSLEFTAPKDPGLYPFVCTFPGHWRMMSGIMKVEKKS